jgi:hypothetical protein
LENLIDLVTESEFPQDMINSRREEIEKTITELNAEKTKLHNVIKEDTFSYEQIMELENFARAIAKGIKVADFETKRRVINLLDVRGKLAIENGEKVVYVTCKLGQQQRSLVQTSHL